LRLGKPRPLLGRRSDRRLAAAPERKLPKMLAVPRHDRRDVVAPATSLDDVPSLRHVAHSSLANAEQRAQLGSCDVGGI